MIYDLGIDSLSVKPGTYPLIIYMLIRQHSSPEERLTMKDIEDTLALYWSGDPENENYRKNLRRTIKRNLATLILLDPDIGIERSNGTEVDTDADDFPDDEEVEKYLGEIRHIWYRKALSSTDLQLLTDAVVNSRHLTNAKRSDILDRLFNATGTSYAARSSWYRTVLAEADERSAPVPTDLYGNLVFINNAIKNRQCISFNLCYTGPRNQKYTVKRFAKVSPYKIVHENGTYYLIASFPEDPDKGPRRNELLVIEIHKLDCMESDTNGRFVPLNRTYAAGWSVQRMLTETRHPTRSGHFFFFFKGPAAEGKAELKVNAEGLDILIDRFGNRVTRIQLINETDPDAEESAAELRHMYKVTLTNMIFNEWDELALLRYRYPKQIRILEPQGFMDSIRYNLERFSEMYPDGEGESE
ncbi:MAG: WYL domain-containing protein [Lachnospiraceae bacterium]|nr:WYL domain-containing protein [Lachnospiraceae bacterium]